MIELPKGTDTHPEAARRMLAYWRSATPDEKLARMFGMAQMINDLARADLRRRYPDATPREIDLRLRSRTLDRETMIKAFGWDPDIHGK